MLRVGLTGGIGSGKTTVARYFEKLGVPIIDADVIARQVVEPNTPAMSQILQHFGNEILTPQGNINREKLRQIVFENPSDRLWLEKILHPQIRAAMKAQIAEAAQKLAPYCILVIPLLAESNEIDFIDRILVIDTPESLQIDRVKQRDGASAESVKSIINTQASRTKRLEMADDILLNDGSLEKLNNKIKDLHDLYLSLAKE